MTSDALGGSWTSDDLDHLHVLREMEISALRAGGGRGPWTPIWVVVAHDEVFVRTWRRRETGWYGRAVESARASIRVASHTVDVLVTAVGDTDAAAVDAAYRAKYGPVAAQSMNAEEAAASTLRLTPVA